MNGPIKKIRGKMKDLDIDLTIVPLSDPHMSEYMSADWEYLKWLSGFTGSAGTLVITQNMAGLWTDSRYFIQAENELNLEEIDLYRQLKREDHYQYWIKDNLDPNSTIGLDGRLFSLSWFKAFKKELADSRFRFIPDFNSIDDVWDQGRPSAPLKKIFLFDNRYAGVPRINKISEVQRIITKHKADWYLVSALDEIAWVLNLRGKDVNFNPVFYAYLLIGLEDSYLFIDERKVPEAVQRVLESENIYIENYQRINDLTDIAYGKIIMDESSCSISTHHQLRPDSWISQTSYIKRQKATKSLIEIQHIEDAMVQDGVALCQAFMWLESQIDKGPTEYEFAQKISACRKQQLGYYGDSFPAIVGSDEHGAIVHYRPKEGQSKVIDGQTKLLCDSGGQYLNGTTDITRTIAFGVIPIEFKRHYTQVLKGHIALATAIFPIGTHGGQLDILARQALWSEGLNFGHGTGHGVGYFLNVHEGPQSISPRATVPLDKGMVISNEPGYYQEGAYGIRIENLILVEDSEYEGFLKFKTITLFPIATDCIDITLLSMAEIEWLNTYHRLVFESLKPKLSDEEALWLEHKCLPISQDQS